LINQIVDDVLDAGLDDWLMASMVLSIVMIATNAGSSDEASEMTLSVIATMLDEGLVQAGDITEGRFERWEISTSEAMRLIETEWHQVRGRPDLGEVCWLNNTPAGDTRARSRMLGGA
jgi:hypothetical protein